MSEAEKQELHHWNPVCLGDGEHSPWQINTHKHTLTVMTHPHPHAHTISSAKLGRGVTIGGREAEANETEGAPNEVGFLNPAVSWIS